MELVVTSIIAFASTNIDDIFILMLFFANKDYKAKDVVIGQYIGIVVLIVISFIGSFIGLLFNQVYIGLLGLLPVYFGICGLFRLIKHNEKDEKERLSVNRKKANKILLVAAVTFANGGDNIGIYIPLFATLLMPQKIIMAVIFLVMVAVWCIAARYLSNHPIISKNIDTYGHIISPIVLILLGIYILCESGSFRLL
jgi:cadmium resistance transport/sequestration family protein